MYYDVVIAGGSIAGLLCAREVANNGHSVLVLEEDYEIGTPEHCGGLVSIMALEELGIIPHRKTFVHYIESAEIFSPAGKRFSIKCKIIVDARGVSALINKDRTGILSSAQYEVYADWIKNGRVEVYFDQKKYPGFFAWIIPSSDGVGKVGVAGRAINAADALEEFLSRKGSYSTIRKIFAPIWIKGPIDKFVSKNIVIVGDAAGQSKPTTAGGIFSCGVGGILAGQAISKYLESGNEEDLNQYQKLWNKKFGKEFEKQLLARKILERLDNATIDKLFDSVTPEILKEISNKDDFDFHTSSIIKLLGVKGSFKAAQIIMTGEMKNLLS